jgi:hypothetical protein
MHTMARVDSPDPNDRVTRPSRDDDIVDAEIVDDHTDPVTGDRVVEREVIVDRDDRESVVGRDLGTRPAEHVVADTETLDRGQHVDPEAEVVSDRAVREEVIAREKERFGGMKFGSAFFGWLTAAGTAVLLTTAVTAASLAIGLRLLEGEEVDRGEAEVLGIAGIITIAAILFVAYLAGGYVAGRMARFSGAKQGVAVWLWSIVIAVVAAIIGLLAGSPFDILERLNALPRLPLEQGDLTVSGIVTAILALLISLLGAVLGGLAGMRYHRRVDRVGLEPGRGA